MTFRLHAGCIHLLSRMYDFKMSTHPKQPAHYAFFDPQFADHHQSIAALKKAAKTFGLFGLLIDIIASNFIQTSIL